MKFEHCFFGEGGEFMDGITLKMLRVKYNLSQKEAADLVGVSEGTWRNWETYKTYPTVDMVMKIEKEFKVPYDEIIFLNPNTVLT